MPFFVYLKRTVLAAAIVTALVYGGDYLSLRYQIPKRDQYGSVEVRRFYIVKLKNRKTEYLYDDPMDENCVRSLFPHYGTTPCWYLERHKQQEIRIDSGPMRLKLDLP